ncbi:bacteriohemerythrin [Leeia sp. TBRC 13508]|uniref:Bacteriohemerythrin n=1 Tax=Leeia speluncae TaxID=2884804 RepID=A0ABS8D1P4_9NEIS|nr:bacteriohemerythrin [Leeia speluncae]MCB6182106.1 bacteriohemerythrin [Leeia speluncae]
MAFLEWTSELNTGIDVIDNQHRRIVDYINQLDQAKAQNDKALVAEVIDSTIDYTMSHFAFEEALIEDAGYPFAGPHKKVHELFIKRVTRLQERFNKGEDIAEELHNLLSRWLFSHIRSDDFAYVDSVRKSMQNLLSQTQPEGWFTKAVGRFFRKAY